MTLRSPAPRAIFEFVDGGSLMYVQPTTPQSIGGVLDNGFKLFKASFKDVFALAFVGAVISGLPNVYMTRSLVATMPDPTPVPEAISRIFGAEFFGLMALMMVITIVVFAAIVARMGAVATGTECSIAESLGLALRRFPALFVAGILYSLLVGIGMFLLVIPGIILAVSLYGTMYLVIIDRLGPIAAIKQSHKLVWGDWWRTATILTVALIIGMAVFVLVGIVAGVVAASADAATPIPLTPLWYDLLLGPAVAAVVTPLLYAMPLVMLQDLKLRREGDDLVERMESLDRA